MANAIRDAVASVRSTAVRSFDFIGRARRLDFFHYWLGTMIAGLLGEAIIDYAAQGRRAEIYATLAMKLIFSVPVPALLARRLHDFGRTGWWALMALPLVAASSYKTLLVNFHAYGPDAWPALGIWEAPLVVCAVLMLATIVVPGDDGPNRYGHDPRQRPETPRAEEAAGAGGAG